MTFDVKILWRAERDVDHIVIWLGERSTQGAAAWYRAWKETLRLLELSASSFGLAPENEDQELEIRQVTFHTSRGHDYRALYTIEDRQVFVMHVRAPGQNIVPPDQLQLPQS